MTYTYYYQSNGTIDIEAKTTTLGTKLSTDPELITKFVSVNFNSDTQNVEVVFTEELVEQEVNILIALVNINIYGKIVQFDFFVINSNTHHRNCFVMTSAPDANHDGQSAYTIGSLCLTTTNEIFFCSDNTVGAAVWRQIYPPDLTSVQNNLNSINPVPEKNTVNGNTCMINLTQLNGHGYETSTKDWENVSYFTFLGKKKQSFKEVHCIVYLPINRNGSQISITPESSNDITPTSSTEFSENFLTSLKSQIRIVDLTNNRNIICIGDLPELYGENSYRNPTLLSLDIDQTKIPDDVSLFVLQVFSNKIGIHSVQIF